MPGELRVHPYYKSFDELQRTGKRMNNYKNVLRDPQEAEAVDKMLYHINEALAYIPQGYKLTKHELLKREQEEK